jgi:murein L,D-transpeptidase YcbB/YkuD
MAGRIGYAVVNPYWNLPPDLAQERARRVLRQGVRYLDEERLESLSGWEDGARILSPKEVDWKAVASGRQELRMRQKPGGNNFMGKIKFMLPNPLGIYLHDTPRKELFAGANRRQSSGCVRVEDAARLARWLFNGNAPDPATAGQDKRVDLPEPVPVYITYLTVESRAGGLALRSDPYRRDPSLIAKLDLADSLAAAGSAARSR